MHRDTWTKRDVLPVPMNHVELDVERRASFNERHHSFSRTAVDDQCVVVEAWIHMQHNIILIALQIDFESAIRSEGECTAHGCADATNLLPVAVPLT